MAYSSGLLNKKVEILNKVAPEAAGFGDTTRYECVACVWADITWSKGTKALREGALDAYDVVMVRMRWNKIVTRDSRLRHEGKTYQITSLNADRRENQVQIIAQEII